MISEAHPSLELDGQFPTFSIIVKLEIRLKEQHFLSFNIMPTGCVF